jgi:glutathione S-transferase
VLNWAGFVGISLAAYPKIQAYMANIAARPASIKAMVAEGLMEQST